MNRGQFFKLLRHPGSVNKQSLQAMERLLYRYPYFQGARVLVARSKHLMRQLDARKNIHLASLYTTDKQQFKNLMLQKTASVKSQSSNRSTRTSSTVTSGSAKKSTTPSGRLKKPSYVVPTLSEQEREQLVDSVMHELDNLKHNMGNFVSAEQSRGFRFEEERKRHLEQEQAKATLEAERQKIAEEQQRLEAKQKEKEHTKLDAEHKKIAEEQNRLEAEQKGKERAELDAERQKIVEEQKRLEAEQKGKERAELDAERKKITEEQKRLEAEQKGKERAELDAERKKITEEQKRLEVQRAAELNHRLEEKIKALETQLETERQKLSEEQKRHEAQRAAELNHRLDEKIKALEALSGDQKDARTSSAHPSSYESTPPAELIYTGAPTNAPTPYSYTNYNASLPSYPINYPYVAPMQAYPLPIYFHPQFSMPTTSHQPNYTPSSSPFQFSFVLPQPTSAVPTTTSIPFSTPMPPPVATQAAPLPPPATQAAPTPAPRSNAIEQRATIEHFIDSLSKDKSRPSPSPDARLSSNDTINEEICSVELAELYHNQGHIERAVEIYQRLCDKYPEKIQYFLQKIKSMRKT